MGSNGDHDVREIPRPVDVRGALVEILGRLDAVEGPRALIGGVALAIYGIERFTKDADLAVSVAQSGAAEKLLADADPRPLRIGGVSVASSSGVRIDLIDHRFKYRALFEEAIAAAVAEGPTASLGERTIPVVPLVYLIALKLAAGRPRDESDLEAILRQRDLDYRRAREVVAKHLGDFAARYLDRLARAAGRIDTPRDYDDGDPYT